MSVNIDYKVVLVLTIMSFRDDLFPYIFFEELNPVY